MTSTVRPGLELTWLASCCALQPRLDGVLLLDLPPEALPDVAEGFRDVLALAGQGLGGQGLGGQGASRTVRLGLSQDEDALWTSLRLHDDAGPARLATADGPLVRAPHEGRLVVAVPDLARLPLPAARAATALLDAPVASLQRHGRDLTWATGTLWLAACSSAEIGQVSPHLLDRFAVRFPAGALVPRPDPLTRVEAALAGAAVPRLRAPLPPRAWRAALASHGAQPELDGDAVAYAVALHARAPGLRRPLGLLRLAVATARLAGRSRVDRDQVEEVAVLTGLVDPTLAGARVPDRPTIVVEEVPSAPEVRARSSHLPAPEPVDRDARDLPVLGVPAEVLEAGPAAVRRDRSFPEDTAEPDRELAPLQLPWQRQGGRSADRGTVVGTEPARSLHDLAWFDTLRSAALYRHVRPGAEDGDAGLVVSPADLRSYRRAPHPDSLLVLVLDHTCRGDWDWLPHLAPYLHQAYADRAAVCLVEVGGAGAPSPLRAERRLLRNLLDPRLPAALERRPGGATPLAHGLELALAAVRHAVQHGAAGVTRAQLVLVTDGLGNVPLSASLRDEVTGPVAGEGVADALDSARSLRELDRLRAVVVEPPAVRHPEILLDLVEAVSVDRALVPAQA